MFCYRELAESLAGRSVFGVQAAGVDGRQPPHTDVGEMADAYIKAIRDVFPDGPYHLAGWSLGGNLAYEIACRLREQGAEVGLLGLLDAGATPPAESLQEDDFLHLLGALFPGDDDHLPLAELREMDSEQQLQFFLQRAVKAGLAPAGDMEAGRHVFQVFQANVKALHDHRPRAFAGRVDLFRPSEQSQTHALADDPQLGWGELALGGVSVHQVPGTHAKMVRAPHARHLAEALAAAMDAGSP